MNNDVDDYIANYIAKDIQEANSIAATLQKCANSVCTELDELGINVLDGDYYHNIGDMFLIGADNQEFYDYHMDVYFDDELKNTEFAITIDHQTCTAVAVKSGSCYGTVPKVLTAANYDDKIAANDEIKDVLNIAKIAAGYN